MTELIKLIHEYTIDRENDEKNGIMFSKPFISETQQRDERIKESLNGMLVEIDEMIFRALTHHETRVLSLIRNLIYAVDCLYKERL